MLLYDVNFKVLTWEKRFAFLPRKTTVTNKYIWFTHYYISNQEIHLGVTLISFRFRIILTKKELVNGMLTDWKILDI